MVSRELFEVGGDGFCLGEMLLGDMHWGEILIRLDMDRWRAVSIQGHEADQLTGTPTQ